MLAAGSVNPEQTFEMYELRDEANRPIVEGLIRLAQAFVRDAPVIRDSQRPFGGHPRGLLITGEPGRGKTHLVNALINRVISREPALSPFFAITKDTTFHLSSYFHSIMGRSDDGVSAKVVIIDDAGAEDITSSGRVGMVDDAINHAYDHGKFLIITSNYGAEKFRNDMQAHDPSGRAASRFDEMFPPTSRLALVGTDFRKEIAERRTDPFGY